MAPRPFDDIRTGLDLFEKWPMMSVHFWSEPVVTKGRKILLSLMLIFTVLIAFKGL